jgi:hypothetical protein
MSQVYLSTDPVENLLARDYLWQIDLWSRVGEFPRQRTTQGRWG